MTFIYRTHNWVFMNKMTMISLVSLGITAVSIILFIANMLGWIYVGFLPLFLLFIPLVLPFGFGKKQEQEGPQGDVDYCPECGNMVFPDEEFCEHCGRMLH